MKIFLAPLLLLFNFAISNQVIAQNCPIYPNTQILIQGNGVKKQSIVVADKWAKTKFVMEVIFFDSNGVCFKKVSRDQSGQNKNYSYTSWSTNPNSKEQFVEYGYYDKDSNEVMSSRESSIFDDSKKLLFEKQIMNSDSGYHTYITQYTYFPNGSHLNSPQFELNSKNDTVKKTISILNDSSQTNTVWIKSNSKWIEKSKQVYKYDKNKNFQSFEEFEYGKLKKKSTWKNSYNSNGELTETNEFDINNNLKRRTEYDDRCRTYYTYSKGAIVHTETECDPYADPIEGRENPIIEPYLEDNSTVSTNTATTTSPPTKSVKPHFEPRSETTYLDPEAKTTVGMIEYWDETGLIIKRDVLWDGKVYTWSYDFY